MVTQRPTVRSFLWAFGKDWAALMSGGLSVPFGLLANKLTPGYARISTQVLAVLCFAGAAYFLWARERRAVIGLTARLQPRLRCTFSLDDPGCFRPNTKTIEKTPHTGRRTVLSDWYRIRIENLAVEPVHNCRGMLLRIRRDGEVVMEGESISLPIAHSGGLEKAIHGGAPVHLDFAVILDGRWMRVASQDLAVPNSVEWDAVFGPPGNYQFEIAVISDGPTVLIAPTIEWTGNRKR